MTWVRDYSSGLDASGDRQSGGASIPYLLVGNVEPAAIQAQPENFIGGDTGTEPLPRYGAVHPANPRLKLDRYDVSRDGATTRIVGLYSNDARFQFPIIPGVDEQAGIVGYSSTREHVLVPLPYAKKLTVSQADPYPTSGQSTITTDVWKIVGRTIKEGRRTRSWDVLIRYDQIANTENLMDKLDQKLNNIFGRWYLYESSDVTNAGRKSADGVDLYKVTHRWTYDPGTPYPWQLGADVAGTPASKNYLQAFTSGLVPGFNRTPGWLRPPFHEVVANEASDTSNLPTFNLVLNYEVDALGWRDLPGLNL